MAFSVPVLRTFSRYFAACKRNPSLAKPWRVRFFRDGIYTHWIYRRFELVPDMDRSRELLALLAGAKIVQPSTFIAGEEDLVVTMYRRDFDLLEQTMPNLTAKTLIQGAGHWVQQEKPAEVNACLLRFLSTAWPANSRQHSTPR